MTRQRRTVSYTWRLRQVMAERGMYATTELVPLLAERGVTLSVSQVHRLVTSPPERLNMTVLAALCDIFTAGPSDLIVTDAANVGVRKVAQSNGREPGATSDLRPIRATVVPDADD